MYNSHQIDKLVKLSNDIIEFITRINKQLDFEGKFGEKLDRYVEETSPQTDSDEQ